MKTKREKTNLSLSQKAKSWSVTEMMMMRLNGFREKRRACVWKDKLRSKREESKETKGVTEHHHPY